MTRRMRMKKLIALSMALTMLLPVGAYAAVTDNNDMTVNITEETEIADAMMAVDVILPGYTYSDLFTAEKAEYLDMIAYSEQTITDDAGLLDVTFKLRADSPSGNYTFIIKGMDYKKEITSFVLNDELSQAAMEAIENALISDESDESKIDAIKTAIMVQPAEYGIDKTGYTSEFEDADWTKTATLSYKYMKSENITEVDTEQASKIFNKAVAIVSLENGLVENIIEDALLFDLASSELTEWYKKDFVTEFTGERMAERLEDEEFLSFEEFDEALTESYVLSVIEKPDGWGNTKLVMQEFSDHIGTGESGTDKRYAYVSDKNWDSYNDLKEAFDEYKEPSKPSGGSGGGGGSGSSGGLRGGISGAVIAADKSTDKQQQEEKKTYPLNIFNDLETVAWAEEAIIDLTEKGVLNGVGNDMFAPNDFITREEFSAMLVRAFLPGAEAAEISFSDTNKSEWYYESVAKAYGAGIVKGESEGLFGTGSNITRQDMAVMLYRVGEYIKLGLAVSEDYTKFDDDALISDYAKTAVYALREAEIINGVSDLEFAPLENATRAQAAKMIYGLLEL